MSDASGAHDRLPRHPNDTLQVVVTMGGGFLLVQQLNRTGGSCWELPGGSYQLNQGLSPEAAAVATLRHQVGLKFPKERAQLIYVDHPWNGLDHRHNQCAAARVYVVLIADVLAEEYRARSDWSLESGHFYLSEIGTPGFRLDWFAHAALNVYRTQYGGVKTF